MGTSRPLAAESLEKTQTERSLAAFGKKIKGEPTMSKFHFTNTWFGDTAQAVWDQLIPQINPSRILEIGSYEGACACYLIDKLAKQQPLELHCIDTWAGGVEHLSVDMDAVEERFKANLETAMSAFPGKIDLHVHKGFSDARLALLLTQDKACYFDFIYVDGSHQAPDVLCDAVLAFRLLKVGGILVFDDYLWGEELAQGRDLLRCPKPAIDAFTNLYTRKLHVLPAPLYQLFVQKTQI
jgi:predicted O-methyltransferase YrrM